MMHSGQDFAGNLNVVVIGGSRYLKNKIITNRSSGIGKAIVTRFAKSGCNVLATFFSNSQSAHDLKKQHTNVEFTHLDQGEITSIETFTALAKEWLSRTSNPKIDILVNNAALGSATVIPYIHSKLNNAQVYWQSLSTARKRALEDEALMKVNALGPLWLTEGLLPLMKRMGEETKRDYGTIVFFGSVGGSVGVFPEYRASDQMSKSAVSYLSKHLAAENVYTNIDVFCLSPGATWTDMFQKSTIDTCADPNAFVSQMPKRRLIEPSEIADAVFTFTTNKWARVFHGAVLDASLGLGVRPGLQTENSVDRGVAKLYAIK
jgi:NAD(P)-dependent dehydrogenase (short-subunit alcohol dehydrogenase family)